MVCQSSKYFARKHNVGKSGKRRTLPLRFVGTSLARTCCKSELVQILFSLEDVMQMFSSNWRHTSHAPNFEKRSNVHPNTTNGKHYCRNNICQGICSASATEMAYKSKHISTSTIREFITYDHEAYSVKYRPNLWSWHHSQF